MKTLWITLVLGACAAPSAESLCDGSDDVRLAAISYGGAVDSTTEFLHPWGHTWLQVDGHCTWHASSPVLELGEWRDVMTGTLDVAAADQLLEDLLVDEWSSRASTAGRRPYIDGGVFIVRHEEQQWVRAGDLNRLNDVSIAAKAAIERLIAGGEVARGDGVLVHVIRDTGAWAPEPWQTDAPETDLAGLADRVQQFSAQGVQRDGEAAAPWRAMREAFLTSGSGRRHVPRTEIDGEGYYMLVREDLDLPTAATLHGQSR